MAGKVLGIIPARGGSKRVPKKNVRMVGGKPLIAWTIEAANKSGVIDSLYLSSDDDEIITTAKKYGCKVNEKRPESLSTDLASTKDVILHEINNLKEKYEWLVLLQPTTPLRTYEDIQNALKLAKDRGVNSVISLSEPNRSPQVMFTFEDGGCIKPVLPKTMDLTKSRTQDFPEVYAINGSLYVVKVDWFLKNKCFFNEETVPYIVPFERSINIDTEFDLEIADYLLSK